ncbi:autotransporter outer membrane beta-barrel domain-containing protein [Xinfangfangia sp. CPCC 101601]|uniref:Autotransporter outer membrane beta-barrel domain-containing protein n=1 Tax=Pseudogemmobacter lacusdianii TaxID=3069608 RepID=A0ABU0W2M4_9RHOB|nr:autotransporter outer membrane beta-barrel domain-containing protein [Xinfangfangia sp. CPCC 101601]MDQ2068204.1 autotransporter outer membrane beta-barrel domain-containing protein [Xinfangfangia sp. CPCC 101601]
MFPPKRAVTRKAGLLASGVAALTLLPTQALSQETGNLRIISFNSWGVSALREGNDLLFSNGAYDVIAIQEYNAAFGLDTARKLELLGSPELNIHSSGDKGLIHRFGTSTGIFGARGVPYVVAGSEGSRPDTLIASEHLNYWDNPFDHRVGQATELNQWPLGELRPIVVVGDFNAGDVSERGLLEPSQQDLMLRRGRGDANWRAWALEYVARNHPIGSDGYTAAEAYLDGSSDTYPDNLFTDETYPVSGNTPHTLNILKKQYQLLVLPADREPFFPHELEDGSTTWPSTGEDDEAFKWPSWGRTQIDHFIASRPYAKWWEVIDDPQDRYIGGVLDRDLSTGPNGVPFSDHEPIAHELRWKGPKLSFDAPGGVGLIFDAEVTAGEEFLLSRNNRREDVYLGQLSFDDGTPLYGYIEPPPPPLPDFGVLLAQAVYDRGSNASFRAQLYPYVPEAQRVAYDRLIAELTDSHATTHFRVVIETYFQANRAEFPGISSIAGMSWEQWGDILLRHIAAEVQFAAPKDGGPGYAGQSYDALVTALGLDDPAERARVAAVTGLDFENDARAALKIRLNCSDATHLALAGARALCVDDHTRFTSALITEGRTVAIDEAAALGAADAVVSFDNGGLRTAGPADLWAAWTSPITEITQAIALPGQGWIDISHPTVPVALSGGISGPGGLEKRGLGEVVLTASSSYAGDTTVTAGRFSAGAAHVFSPTSTFVVAEAGALDLKGFDQTVSALRNAGLVSLLPAVAQPILIVAGDYTAEGGVLLMDAALVADGGPVQPSRLQIMGDTTGGQDMIHFNSLSFASSDGTDALRLISVAGNSGDHFVLGQRVTNGAYEYTLNRYENGDWVLESAAGHSGARLIRPEVAAYGANLAGAALMFDHSLRDRAGASVDPMGRNWLRIERMDGNLFSGPGGQFDNSFDRSTLQGGFALGAWEMGQAVLSAGMMFGYGQQNGTALSKPAGSRVSSELEGFGLGLYATWQQAGAGQPGWYVDAWAMRGRYQGALGSTGAAEQSYDLDSRTLSLEAGFSHLLRQSDDRAIWIEPSAQVIWSDVKAKGLTDAAGLTMSADGQGAAARIGLRTTLAGALTASGAQTSGFVDLDLWHSFNAPKVVYDGTSIDTSGGSAVRIGLGVAQQWSPAMQTNLKIGYAKGEGDTDAVSLTLGHQISF